MVFEHMSPNSKRPYNSLPKLPPPVDLETKAVLKRCIAARTAIAELRRAGELIPDQSVLINTIPLLEAKDSSEIENIVTTNDALFREASQAEDGGDPSAKEAVRYRSALFGGYESFGTHRDRCLQPHQRRRHGSQKDAGHGSQKHLYG
jgi:Fic family protein